MRVLLADDDLLVRHALNVALTDAGHEPLEVADGVGVLTALKAATVDCLILDLLMPRMTGYDILRWLEGTPEQAGLPVIVLSAFIADSSELRRHPNVIAVLEKPLYVDQLLEALDSVHAEQVRLTA